MRSPLVVCTAPITGLAGVVLGPDDIPLAGARVELPALRLAVRTDAGGRFRFAGIPGGKSAPQHLRVFAKGHMLDVTADPSDLAGGSLVIRFEIVEG